MLDLIADNLDTFLTALGFVAAAVSWFLDRYVGQRKTITFRVHLNTPIEVTPIPVENMVELEIRRDGALVPQGSLCLIRVKNAGRLDIGALDVVAPLKFSFPGRTVVSMEIIDPSNDRLRDSIRDDSELRIEGDHIELPKFTLNRSDGFKLLVLLSGEGTAVGVDGYIRGGSVRRDASRTATRGLVLGGTALVLAGLLIGLVIVRDEAASGPVRCVAGELTIEGSSAFAPLLEEISGVYEKTCEDSDITLVPSGSLAGLRRVANAGQAATDETTSMIAVSDGQAPEEYRSLVAHPIGVVVFSVVTNQAAGVHDLTVAQVRDIYAGRVRNWRELGGADLPIRIVSRGSESGTRGVFERRILGQPEPPVSSNDCVSADRDPAAPVVRCEIGETDALLDEVDRIKGTIGYAELSATGRYRDVERITLDGWEPDVAAVKQQTYPFWEVEYFYTYGTPAGDSLISAFLEYMNLDPAKNLLRGEGYTPCIDRTESLMDTLCRN